MRAVRANAEHLVGQASPAELAAARETIRAESARVERARNGYLDGVFDAEEVRRIRAEAASKTAAAREVLARPALRVAERTAALDALISIFAAPDRVLDLPPALLRAVLRAVFLRLDVRRDKTIAPAPDSASAILSSLPSAAVQFSAEVGTPFLERLNSAGVPVAELQAAAREVSRTRWMLPCRGAARQRGA